MNIKSNGNTDFAAFVKRQQTVAQDERVDWVRERDSWLVYLKQL
jgi:hypothetical protein